MSDNEYRFSRIDPPGCGCTDCLTGYSKPLNYASEEEVDRMLAGDYDDATSMPWDDVNERIAEYARDARRHAIRMYTQMRLRD